MTHFKTGLFSRRGIIGSQRTDGNSHAVPRSGSSVTGPGRASTREKPEIPGIGLFSPAPETDFQSAYGSQEGMLRGAVQAFVCLRKPLSAPGFIRRDRSG